MKAGLYLDLDDLTNGVVVIDLDLRDRMDRGELVQYPVQSNTAADILLMVVDQVKELTKLLPQEIAVRKLEWLSDEKKPAKQIVEYRAWELEDGFLVLTVFNDRTFDLQEGLLSLPTRQSDIPMTCTLLKKEKK